MRENSSHGSVFGLGSPCTPSEISLKVTVHVPLYTASWKDMLPLSRGFFFFGSIHCQPQTLQEASKYTAKSSDVGLSTWHSDLDCKYQLSSLRKVLILWKLCINVSNPLVRISEPGWTLSSSVMSTATCKGPCGPSATPQCLCNF